MIKNIRCLLMSCNDSQKCPHQSEKHLKQHTTEAPPVHSWAVWLTFEHLWCKVFWGATKRVHNAAYSYTFFTKSKVCQYDMTITVQQNIFWFEIPKNNRTSKLL